MDIFKRILSVVLIMVVVLAGSAAVCTVQVSAAEQTGTTKVATNVVKKASSKSVKLKSKAKSSKVTTKTTTKKTTTTKKSTDKKVVVQKNVKTVVKSTYKKGSKIKKIKTTVTTTTKTTTTTYKTQTQQTSSATVDSIVKVVPSNVMSAFKTLGFTVKINSQLATAGNFSTSKKCIQLKTANSGHLLHEMGHFLSILKNKAHDTDEFVAIYNEEKDKYTGSNKTYITSTADEYFAESYRDYVEGPDKLKNSRPKTYEYIKKTASSITQEDIDNTRQKYAL